jgi:hemerythrin
MERIEWSPELSVGIDSIDDQHRQLIALAREMQVVAEDGGTREQIKSALDRMLDYAAVHFSTEEDLFEQHGYPEADPHVNEHNLFVMKLVGLQSKFDTKWEGLGTDIFNYLRLWIENHINSTDKAYSQFLIDKGVN